MRTSQPALVLLRSDVLPQRRSIEHEDARAEAAAQGPALHGGCTVVHPRTASRHDARESSKLQLRSAQVAQQFRYVIHRAHLMRICSSSSSDSSSYSLSDRSSSRLLGSTATQPAPRKCQPTQCGAYTDADSRPQMRCASPAASGSSPSEPSPSLSLSSSERPPCEAPRLLPSGASSSALP